MEFLELVNAVLEKNYPSDEVYNPTVTTEIQVREVDRLKSAIPFEQFFLVLNLVERKLEYVHGIEKWLGYRDETFTLYDYLKIIHPSYFPSLVSIADAAFFTANSGEYKLGFMSHSISIQLPLRHASGKYILTKRSLYPFQIDKSGKVLSYLNHYVVLKDFEEKDALEPRVAGKGIEKKDITSQVLEHSKNTNLKSIKWSKKELNILELVVKNPNITNKEIAENLNINLATLQKTDNHRITRKAKDYFKLKSFTSIKDVAFFLKNQGYL